MVSRRHAAIINVLFSYSNTAFAIISGMLLVPLYLRHFDLATYGAWLATGNALSLITLLDGGLAVVIAQRLATAAGASDNAKFSSCAAAGLWLMLLLSLLIMGCGVLLSPYIAVYVRTPDDSVTFITVAFLLAGIGAALTVFQSFLVAVLQAWHLTVSVGISQTTAGIVSLLAVLIALRSGLGVISLGIGVSIRAIVAVLILSFLVFVEWRRRSLGPTSFDRRALVSLARASGPLFVTRIAGGALNNSESVVTSILINPAAAAVLVLTQRIYSVGAMLVTPLYSAAFSGIAHFAARQSGARIRSMLSELIDIMSAATAVFFGVAVAINQDLIGLWVGPECYGGNLLSLLCAFSVITMTRLTSLASILNALGVIGETAWVSLLELLAKAVLMYKFVDYWGVVGIPLSVIAGSGVVSGVALVLLLRARVPNGAMLALQGLPKIALCMSFGFSCALLHLQITSWWLLISLSVIVAGVLSAVVLAGSPILCEKLTSRINSVIRKKRAG